MVKDKLLLNVSVFSMKSRVWEFSSVAPSGPGRMPVAQPGTVTNPESSSTEMWGPEMNSGASLMAFTVIEKVSVGEVLSLGGVASPESSKVTLTVAVPLVLGCGR
ncbi:MAG TPA: hypothetical protein VFQ26_06455 [Nitrospiraceae bacterium]|nr:hypothetical protein [Nitrospiraceae bacterium]